jgi:2-keto-4-pentenoate hydratase/2-oxohepta-3-ene-1,7-dioic acid hydratase in catechol pathway
MFELNGDGDRLSVAIDQLVVCGFTGRNHADVQAHIEELAREGVPAPDSTPCFWRLPGQLVSSATEIEVDSDQTSGEAEPVLVRSQDEWLVTVGSDHTDRAREREDIVAAKAACRKPIADGAWPLSSVAKDWDRLELRSYVQRDDVWRPYQRATLDVLRPADELLAAASSQFTLEPGTALFLGTPPLLTSGFVFGDAYRVELFHGRAGRTLSHTYRVSTGDAESRGR